MTKLKPESHIAGKGAFQGQRGANAWKATGERKDQGSQSQETGLGKGLKGNLVQRQKIVKTNCLYSSIIASLRLHWKSFFVQWMVINTQTHNWSMCRD